MLVVMKRAKTITGLIWQNIAIRWGALSRSQRMFVVGALVLGALVAVQLATCLFGCPLASHPCASEARPHAAGAVGDEPCPYREAQDLQNAPEPEPATPCDH